MENTIEQIALAIAAAGGESFFVGGCVRDRFFGVESKDIDIEIFGLSKESMEKVLSKFGQLTWAGDDFPVAKMTLDGLDLDFSLPRKERKTGIGHNDFETSFDPFMPKKEAASRRDFTMNAIMENIVTGEILDFFGGILDIQRRVLRHVSTAFAEDALRVLRGFQFAARFGMTMAEETILMCKALMPEFKAITKERLFEEWSKFFQKGKQHHMGLDILMKTAWVDCFPTLDINTLKAGVENIAFVTSTVVGEERMTLGIVSMFIGFPVEAKFFMKQINCPTKMTKEVMELLEFNEEVETLNRKLELFSPKQKARLLVGQFQKHSNINACVVLLKLIGHHNTAKAVELTPVEDFKPRLKGEDLMDKGWSPKRDKGAFGNEVKRLFKLQLIGNLSREELLTKIKVK